MLDRIVDLMEPFKHFYYYDPVQKGSVSIKNVLPAITGKGYESLDIASGGEASVQYFNGFIKNEPADKDALKEKLLKYCGLDTEGMVMIIAELKKLVE